MQKNAIPKYENLHIVFWLIKDTCWMLEWKVLGIFMIVPTIFIALYIAAKTKSEHAFYINLAICFWITANAYWMCCEFLGALEFKNYAGLPFAMGMISVGCFYLNRISMNKKSQPLSQGSEVKSHV